MASYFSILAWRTPWTLAHLVPLSMGFSRQEYWSGLPFPSPGDLPDPGITPGSSELQADSLPSEPPEKPDLCLLAPPIHKTLGPLMTVTLRKVLGRILQKQITNTAHYQRVNCNRYIFFATMKEGKKEKEKTITSQATMLNILNYYRRNANQNNYKKSNYTS